MSKKDINSLSELDSESIYFSLCRGISDSTHIDKLTQMFKITTTKYWQLFESSEFKTKRNKSSEFPDGYNVIQYILPTVRSAYIKFFIETPTLFKPISFTGSHAQLRLELFQLQFNLVEFLNHLSEKYKSNFDKLDDFKNINKESEVLRLIVEDYLSSKVSYVLSVPHSEIQKEIRDSKIHKQLEI